MPTEIACRTASLSVGQLSAAPPSWWDEVLFAKAGERAVTGSSAGNRLMDYMSPSGVRWTPVLASLGLSPSSTLTPTRPTVPTDKLIAARHILPSSLEVTFADGLSSHFTLEQLGIKPGEVDLRTARADETGVAILLANSDESFLIDSATLRYMADLDYAAAMDRAVAGMLIPSEELERTAARYQPPQEWYDEVEDQD